MLGKNQGKIREYEGKIREKSGNFEDDKWQPWSSS